MTATYTTPYRITPAVLLAIEESALASDQESDHQSDQVMRLIRALRISQRSASDLMAELGLLPPAYVPQELPAPGPDGGADRNDPTLPAACPQPEIPPDSVGHATVEQRGLRASHAAVMDMDRGDGPT